MNEYIQKEIDTMRFRMYGKEYEIDRRDVESRLSDLSPDPVQQLAVCVLDMWWPVKQAYGAVMGKDHSQFNSRRAFEIFRRLGFPVHDVKQDGPLPPPRAASTGAATRSTALSLAVALAAPSGRSAKDVIGDAEMFLSWLSA